MILDDFIVQTKTGLYCVYGDFYLDPKLPVKNALISHAHGDHAIPGNFNVYSTLSTFLFMKYRYRNEAAVNLFTKAYDEHFMLNGVRITFIPAGHILGSAQILMEYKGVRYLYTGDYKLQPDDTCEAMKFVAADVLITETTFADKNTRHPDAETEIRKLNDTSTNVMLGAYALGKCQRLISLMTQNCIEKRILVHYSIVPFIKIYESQGVTVGKYELFDRRILKKNKSGIIYLVPPMVFKSNSSADNLVRAFATGWKDLQVANGIALYVSDHADWEDIIYTIDRVKPSQVWTTHGDGLQLQKHYEHSLVVKLL